MLHMTPFQDTYIDPVCISFTHKEAATSEDRENTFYSSLTSLEI